MNINLLVEKIFSKPPEEKNSIQLQLDYADNEYIFQLLLNILLSAIKFKGYSSINELNNNQLIELKSYFNSFGFDIITSNINNINEYNYYCYMIYVENNEFKFIKKSNFIHSDNIETYRGYYISNEGNYFISVYFKFLI